MLSVKLKEETKHAHLQTEKLIIPSIKSLDLNNSYLQLLYIFYGYFKPVEEKIEQYLSPNVVSDIAERRKAGTILKDMEFVGAKSKPSLCDQLPAIENAAEALGAMYVLEGSTLGGKHICKMIEQKLPLTEKKGLGFFTGYGTKPIICGRSLKICWITIANARKYKTKS